MTDIKKELKQYDIMHQLDLYKNYDNATGTMNDCDKVKLAEYIHDNYNTMDDIEMKILALRCLEQNRIKQILLSFELENYQVIPIEHMSLSTFINHAQKMLMRYQGRAGGFNIEDTEWSVHKFGDSKHDIMENEILLVNTIAVCDEEDDEIQDYLTNIINRLNSIANNIMVELRELHGKRSNHLLIWITDMSIDNIIGL